jgi:hypothetical protein
MGHMAGNGLTLGDLKGFLQLAGSSVVVDFDSLFAAIKTQLKSFGLLTAEVSANIDLALAELKANPGLFDIGKATFVASLDELLSKYPANTLLSDIPEFNGSTSPDPEITPGVTTIPSSVVFSFFNAAVPDAAKLAALADFAKGQFEAYKNAGVARAEIGPYEALGRGFAETISFDTKYGKLTVADFVTKAYNDIFERTATSSQLSHFQNQISYFENLYKTAGMAAAAAALLAKGAVAGQMLGFAVLDEASQHPYITTATKGLAMSSTSAAFGTIEPQHYDLI